MDRSFRRKSTPALPAIRMQLPSNVPDAVILSGRYIDLHDPLFAEHGAPEKGQDHETGQLRVAAPVRGSAIQAWRPPVPRQELNHHSYGLQEFRNPVLTDLPSAAGSLPLK
jgi:hypothetical protein